MTAEMKSMNLTEVLAEFVPFQGSEEAEKLIARWTKYNRLGQGTSSETYPINIGNELSIVAVVNPNTKGIALVLRSLEEQQPLSDDKTFNVYGIDGLRKVESAEEAREALRVVRQAYENRVMEEVDGFGGPAADLDLGDLGDLGDGTGI